MTSYPTLQNPLLSSVTPDKPTSTDRALFGGRRLFMSTSASIKDLSSQSFKNFFSRSFHQLSSTGSQVRLSSKRVVPVKEKSKPPFLFRTHKPEPIVHYNGLCETLQQLPDEKLAWIKHDSIKPSYPSLDRSLVLRKPYTRSQTYPQMLHLARVTKPKAMFYLRVLQIIDRDSTKPSLLRCSVQHKEEVCTGTYVSSQKSGKTTVQADMDETFLFDVDKVSIISLRIFSQQRHNGLFQVTGRGQEVCLGRQDFEVALGPEDKQLRRLTIGSQHGQVQVLVMYGTFVSNRAQLYLENRQLFADYVTVYIRGNLTPKWDRFWAVLLGQELVLFDFEYKERRRPVYTIPLNGFLDVFHPPTDDDERQVDVGSLGLALQFDPRQCLSKEGMKQSESIEHFECRMYLLPDNVDASQLWEDALAYSAALINEFQEEDDHVAFVPCKFLW